MHKAQYKETEEKLKQHPLSIWLKNRKWKWFHHQIETAMKASLGHDVLVLAPTGAGKTLSGFLPSFLDIYDKGSNGCLHTLYISPLKALTVDVHRNITRPIESLNLPITYETRTGDTPSGKRKRQRISPPDFLMTTPESLALLLSYEEAASYFSQLRFVIIDELHTFFDNKRGDLLSLNLERVASLAPQAIRVGLSATINKPRQALEWLSRDIGSLVEVQQAAKPKIEILETSSRIPWSGHSAKHVIENIYENISAAGMSIIFVNTRAQAEFLFQELWQINDNHRRIALHHGSLERDLRRKVEASMATGKLDCVVATSSLDLGLDWAEIDLVIQIGAPKGVSRLIQRVGRSNHRIDQPSRAILVPTNRFEYLECLAAKLEIESGSMDGANFRVGGLDVLAQHLLGTACSGDFYADALYAEVIRATPYNKLDRTEFDAVIDFVTNGGYALKTYPQYNRLLESAHGTYSLRDGKLAKQYRMNIGTIVESPMLKVKLRNRTLGNIEENFILNLSQGDTFLFGGMVLKFERLHDAAVLVSKTKNSEAQIPSYAGGRLPLTTNLASAVRLLIGDKTNWEGLPSQIQDWLTMQDNCSHLPDDKKLITEVFEFKKRFYFIVYTFSGRNANQTLGFLLLRRMRRAGLKPMGFSISDYALAVWSFKPVEDAEKLLEASIMVDDFEEWLEETPLLKRLFRDAAIISGLVERRHPGQVKTGRQILFSSDLIYDVLRRYEPDHIILKAVRRDAMEGLIDAERLASTLAYFQDNIIYRKLDYISPMAVPLVMQISKESTVWSELTDDIFAESEEEIIRAARVESLH
ncbi:MAG: DNA ligase-associated DEXH box helicase [Rhodospirillaceae bacterium]|nr:DNA ligase-associated DEXH box helicase [Rhodospirillaceae bacterium]